LTSIRLVPPALAFLESLDDNALDGYLLPGHVCAVIGLKPFEPFRAQGVFQAVAGFEPVEIMYGFLDLVEQAKSKTPRLGNAYKRLVRYEGNQVAVRAMEQVFEPVDSTWRGIGVVPNSGYALREAYASVDARKRFDLSQQPDLGQSMPEGCACGAVLTGQSSPQDCPNYGGSCTPASPLGPCMVSFEGSCRIVYQFEGAPNEKS